MATLEELRLFKQNSLLKCVMQVTKYLGNDHANLMKGLK